MKNAFAIVTLSAALSACAVAPQQGASAAADTPGAAPLQAAPVPPPPALPAGAAEQQAEAAAATAVAPAASAAPAAAAPAASAAPPVPGAAAAEGAAPNVPLSADLMYKLTKAELEFKQGNWQGPFLTLMGVAQQTRDPRLAHRAAEMALEAKQPGPALAAIRLWHNLAPDSEEATQYYLGFIVMTDEIEEVEPVFAERLKNARPGMRGFALFQMQQILARAKDKLITFAMTERLVEPYLDMWEAHLVLAQGAVALNEPQRAQREARKALELKPDSELAALALAQMSGNADAAKKVLGDFLASYPAAVEVRTAYARILAEQQQFGAAREQFLVLHKAQPNNVTTLYALGIVSLQMGQADQAEGYFKQFLVVLAANPKDQHDSSKVLSILAQIADDRGDLKGAIAWLDKIDPAEAQAYFSGRIKRAQLLARSGKLDAGRAALAELKPEAQAGQVLIFLADAQMLRDANYDDTAFTVLRAGLQQFPGNTELLYDYALAAEKLNKVDIMEASLRQVIAQAPENRHAYNALGYSFAERNVRLPEALQLIETALKMAPEDPFIMDSMGWVQYRMGNLPQAEDYLRRAYALRNDPEIGVHLGEVLFQKGDQNGARGVWREARAKDPKNDTLKSTLARLNQKL